MDKDQAEDHVHIWLVNTVNNTNLEYPDVVKHDVIVYSIPKLALLTSVTRVEVMLQTKNLN